MHRAEAGIEFIAEIGEALIDALLKGVEALVDLIEALVDLIEALVGLIEALVGLVEALVGLVDTLINFVDTLINLIEALINLIEAPIDAIKPCLNPLLQFLFAHRQQLRRDRGYLGVLGLRNASTKGGLFALEHHRNAHSARGADGHETVLLAGALELIAHARDDARAGCAEGVA